MRTKIVEPLYSIISEYDDNIIVGGQATMETIIKKAGHLLTLLLGIHVCRKSMRINYTQICCSLIVVHSQHAHVVCFSIATTDSWSISSLISDLPTRGRAVHVPCAFAYYRTWTSTVIDWRAVWALVPAAFAYYRTFSIVICSFFQISVFKFYFHRQVLG